MSLLHWRWRATAGQAVSNDSIVQRQELLKSRDDSTLEELAADLRDRWHDGEPEGVLAGEMFALVGEAVRRQLGIDLRATQLEAGRHLLQRRVVELPTGEGKTFAAAPALAVRALAGRGAWLATANDYLARRDALTLQGVFELLGLSVGFVQAEQTPAERRRAYACDITYGTIREFGFDFLRDRLASRRQSHGEEPALRLQRERYSLLVDEADSILLDDARTPLIISEPETAAADEALVGWSVATGRSLCDGVDYFTAATSAQVWLAESGRAAIRNAARSEVLSRWTLPEAYDAVTRAIQAERSFQLNRDFVIRQGKIVVVDRQTGRLAEGRQWQHGVQQALEAAHRLEQTPETRAVARVTIQSFLRGFEHLSGMTGTAQEAARELRTVYGARCVTVPPHRPCRRVELPVSVCRTRTEKWDAVVSAVRAMQSGRRPVLIGTRDLNASTELSNRLESAGIAHQMLTAKQEASEADLIARAGEPGLVTVSTNIAGRGTDIRLGRGVAEAGGLHVIAADLFDSPRIDRQLAGRGGRQGDPATYQQILSLEDELLAAAWDDGERRRRRERACDRGIATRYAVLKLAQQTLERRHAAARHHLFVEDRERVRRQRELGLDPCLDEVDS